MLWLTIAVSAVLPFEIFSILYLPGYFAVDFTTPRSFLS